MKKVTTPFMAANTKLSLSMYIKHTFVLAMTSLLLALTLPAQADIAIPTIVFGANAPSMRDLSNQDIELNFNLAFAKFSEANGIIAKLKVYDSHQSLMAALDQGQIDGIFSVATDILAREDQLNPKMVVVVYANGQYKFRFLLVVRKADTISSIEQLQGKRVSMPQSKEIENLYLNTLLLKHKLAESSQFFSEIVNTSNSNTTIGYLFFNRVDAVIVNANEYQTAIELNPQVAQKTIIIDQSESLVLLAGAVRKTIPEDVQTRMFNAAVGFDKTEGGGGLFKMMGLSGIRPMYPNDLDTLRTLQSEYDQLKSASSLKPQQKSGASMKSKSKPESTSESTSESSQASTASDKGQRNKKPDRL